MPAVGSRRNGLGRDTLRIHVQLPASLVHRFDQLYTDPATKQPIYGARSQIMTMLLERHVSEKEKGVAAKADQIMQQAEPLKEVLG